MNFPGLERCDHGEYLGLGRHCVKCDLEAKAAEIDHLRDRNDFLSKQIVELGHEVTRLRIEKDQYEKQWQATVERVASLETALDCSQDDHRRIAEENKQLRAENSLLLTCHGFVEYDVRDMVEPCEPPELSEFSSKQVSGF